MIYDVNILLVLLSKNATYLRIHHRLINWPSVHQKLQFFRIHTLHGCQRLSIFAGISQHEEAEQPFDKLNNECQE